MNTILLQPTDVLFFRDGRPMSGSLAGHTAAWPLPDVTNHALHAALHRAEFSGTHEHRRGQSGKYSEQRDRKFGSLATAGPFPVNADGRWFFPRPRDAQLSGSVKVTHQPVRSLDANGNSGLWLSSSLPAPLEYAVGNTVPPQKETAPEPWLTSEAYAAYLAGQKIEPHQLLRDESIAEREANLGIAIDPETQTAGRGEAAGQIYTAYYLRLRDEFRMGIIAEAHDKQHGKDLIGTLFNGKPTQIVVGGQQRLCTARRENVPTGGLPMPRGLCEPGQFRGIAAGKFAVKWILLSPAVFPEIPGTKRDGTPQNPHPGGWLPNWVDPQGGKILLTAGPGFRKSQRRHVSAGGTIAARLVAAMVPKPVAVTGWALPNSTGRAEGGAKSAHLAVPPGAVYYFEAESPEEAAKLAGALNWHGTDSKPMTIRIRRSTLLGEKGYGLGVCGTWDFFENVSGRPQK
jgi:CRISPR/Cas system CMR-associated protein Cmr3 (group 5 of RAMP superfamily)